MTGQINHLAALAAVNELQRTAERRRNATAAHATEQPRRRQPFAARLRLAPRAA